MSYIPTFQILEGKPVPCHILENGQAVFTLADACRALQSTHATSFFTADGKEIPKFYDSLTDTLFFLAMPQEIYTAQYHQEYVNDGSSSGNDDTQGQEACASCNGSLGKKYGRYSMGCHCTVKPCEHPLVCNSCGVFFADETRKRRDNPERAYGSLEHGHKGSGYKPHCSACSHQRYESCLQVGMNPDLVGLRKSKGGAAAAPTAAGAAAKASASPKKGKFPASPATLRKAADAESEMDDEMTGEEPEEEVEDTVQPLRLRRAAAPAPLNLRRQPSSSDLQVLASVCSEMSQCTPLTPISQLTRAAEFCDSPWTRTALSH